MHLVGMERRRPWAWAALAIVLLAPSGASAQSDRHRLEWNPEHSRAGVARYIATGTLGVSAIVAEALYRPLAPWSRWSAGGEERLAGMLEDENTRRRVRLASSLLAFSATLQAQLIDPAFVVWAGDRNRDVAEEIYSINGLSVAATAFFASLFTPTVRRPRPSYESCLVDPEYDRTCGEADQVRSLVDDRLAIAFTSAALTCTHHANLPVYGARWADVSACAGATALAATAGLLAFLADRQHPSDVLAAAIVGIVSGFVLPTLIAYR
ncbi:MAG: hypothetical protein H5U40_05310 [Polyangiaceae bacterium]|nr:hypothetical protein [Polyangiaceae bacterium]